MLNQLPFDAAGFPLSSDATAIQARRLAHRCFIEAAEIARQLKCPGIATVEDEYALWLELKDPENHEKGRQRLEAKLRDPEFALCLVPLGLQFGIKLDLLAVEQEIERQIALHGGITQEAAIARLALAFTKKTPEDAANYVARHYEQLSKYLDKKLMRSLHIQMLSQAGLPERAKECLESLLEEGISDAEESRLLRVIAEAEGTDPVDARKMQFKQTDSLSDLATLVDELEYRGEWDSLCEYGEILFERTRSVRDAERLAYESISGKVDEVIERIRSSVSSRIESGKIKVGRRRNVDEPEEQTIYEHPTFGVIALAGYCDAIISDDRFLNQHENIDDGKAQAPIFSTLDLLDALASGGSITTDDRLEYRTQLRRAGYFFVPINEDELTIHISASTVKNDKIVETAELKAIRENIQRVRMSNWLQFPKEVPWLVTTLKVFIRVLKSLWKAGADLSSVTACSNWIVDQVDVRGWAHRLGEENGDNIVKTGRGAHILMLLTPPFEAPREVKDAYWNWVEGQVFAPIKEQYPDLFDWICEWQRRQISEWLTWN